MSLIAQSALKEAHRQYHAEGYTIVRDLIEPAVASEWKRLLQAHFDYGHCPTGVHVMLPDQMPPTLLDACLEGPLAAAAQAIVGEPLEFLSAKPVFKSGEITFASPWHQDTAYWRGCRKLSAWIALERASVDNGCLRVIPGTHHTFIEHDQLEGEGFGNRLQESVLPVERAVDAVMATGDVVFFQDHTVHASHPNLSGRDRWSLIPTWRPAGGEEVSTFWKTPMAVREPLAG